MSASIKSKTISGLAWNGIESFATSAVNFIVSIVLARILVPEDFGLIAIINALLLAASIVVDAGMTNALIRKKDCTPTDFSTAFIGNVSASVLCYAAIWTIAPMLAHYFRSEELSDALRIMGVATAINALSIVPQAILSKKIDFKSQAAISLVACLVASIVAVGIAMVGGGVWALVVRELLFHALRVPLLWLKARWKMRPTFSFESFRSLFGFGSKLMFSSLLDTLYINLFTTFIGKVHSASALGCYTRASALAGYPGKSMASIMQRVAYPCMSRLQDDRSAMMSAMRKFIGLSAFSVFPLMLWIIVMAEPLVEIILTSKWLTIIPLLQILCATFMWQPIHALNLNLLQVKGRSDIVLKIEIAKKAVGATLFLLLLPKGILWVCIGQLAVSLISLVVNCHFGGRLIGMGFMKQLRLLMPTLLNACLMALLCRLIACLIDSLLLQLFVCSITAIIVYFLGSRLMRQHEAKEFIGILKSFAHKQK